MTCSTQSRCDLVPVRSRCTCPVCDLDMITKNPRPVSVCVSCSISLQKIHLPWQFISARTRRIAYCENINYYHPSTKMRKGNVFRCAYLLTVGSIVTITHDALDLTIQGPPSACPALDPDSPSVQGPPRYVQTFSL